MKHIIALLLLGWLSCAAGADAIQLQDNPPERYVVVKGDTLWSISSKFLKDPWRWPEVWKMNREQVKNPHLIYPGDVIVLDTSGGDVQLRLLREQITLEPGVRTEPLERKAIPTIPPSMIAPFLSQPLVIEPGELENAPTIIAADEGHVTMVPGFHVFVNALEEGSDLHWQVYRPGKPLSDALTNELLGIEAVYLGEADVVRYGAPATIELMRTKEEVYQGDRLVKAPNKMLRSFVPRAPDSAIKGRVISIYNGVAEAGPNAIITLDRGSVDGLEDGHVLAIYSSQSTLVPGKLANGEKSSREPVKVKLPDERVGLAMVFRTFNRVSYALVLKASQPVHVRDVAETPPQ